MLSHHHHNNHRNYNLSTGECRRMVENIFGLFITRVQPSLAEEWENTGR